MKIAYICADFGIPIFGYVGSSVHVHEMIEAFQKRGHEVVLFSPSVDGQTKIKKGLNAVEIKPLNSFTTISKQLKKFDELIGFNSRVRFELRSLLYNLVLLQNLKTRLLEKKFDFVYERYCLFNYAGVALARQLGLPHILEINAPLCYEQEKMRGLELKNVALKIERRVFMESNLLAVVSSNLKSYVESLGIPSERVVVVPNGVDPSKFKTNTKIRDRLIQKLNLRGKTVIGFIGSLKPWHGTETLIEAFSQIYHENPKVHLLIVGDGPKRGELESKQRALGLDSSVSWIGNIPHNEVPAYISAMDITVAPYTEQENFYFSPIKLFEYMASEKPVVAGGIGQVNDIIQNGETGILYKAGDVKELKEVIKRLIASPRLRERLGKAGKTWVIQNRTWGSNVTTILKTMNEMPLEKKAGN